ncbi:hypothetical protein [Pseudoruegeria sp. SHC-113]|uniref:hypothetical protein n=1 Tax=Pseudoruegeria sp. SHC-113 TaxID=2855439 RepID=UPI0021BAB11F|nr:hypothetical protein [Pseudoruegeria sp. SHC-113]MCT8159364.1 hypothetical protein [Pseudoruegeria sp. SHC-113]
MTVTITAHANQRIAQRGICRKALNLVALYGHDTPARNGSKAREIRVSQFSELYELGFAVTTIEKALRIRAIITRDEKVQTCYHRPPEKHARPRRSKQVRSLRPNWRG